MIPPLAPAPPPPLTPPPPPRPHSTPPPLVALLFTLLRKFLLPLPRRSRTRISQSSPPVSPPGQRAPSHMPCRLARSSEPLYPVIATQERKKIKIKRHSTVFIQPFVAVRAYMQRIKRAVFTYSFFHAFVEPWAPFPECLPCFFFICTTYQALRSLANCTYCRRRQIHKFFQLRVRIREKEKMVQP